MGKIAVEANNSEGMGCFNVSVCSICDGEDFRNLNLDRFTTTKDREQTPIKTVMIAPLITGLVSENPCVTNKTLCGYLTSYVKEYALTELVLNDMRACARLELFNKPEVNVQNSESVNRALESCGHFVEMKYSNRRDTLRNIDRVVLTVEMQQRKMSGKETMTQEQRRQFVAQWKVDNSKLLHEQLGPNKLE